jgi:hypothetical protein
MCSSCVLFITDPALDFPDFLRRESANKGRVLSESLPFVGRSKEDRHDLAERPLEDPDPLVVATEEPRSIGVPVAPAGQILTGEGEPLGALGQFGRDAPPSPS